MLIIVINKHKLENINKKINKYKQYQIMKLIIIVIIMIIIKKYNKNSINNKIYHLQVVYQNY